MKAEQVVMQTGGPYRSPDLKSCVRRTQLIKEIDFLESVEIWQQRAILVDVTPRRRSIYLSLIASTVLLMSVILVAHLVAGNFLMAICVAPTLIVVFVRWYYDFRLWLRWRHGGDPAHLMKQKLDELANLPPE